MRRRSKIAKAAVVVFVFLSEVCLYQGNRTQVSIEGDKRYINGEITNPGLPAEGLLLNVRMVNAVFEDRGENWKKQVDAFDPEKYTQNFIHRIPEYVGLGVNAFVISLQGGLPGYEGAINTAFEPDGTLRTTYMQRVEKVINAADREGAVIIHSCFYQRQRDHDFALENKQAIIEAVTNTADWLSNKGFTHVVLEIAKKSRFGDWSQQGLTTYEWWYTPTMEGCCTSLIR